MAAVLVGGAAIGGVAWSARQAGAQRGAANDVATAVLPGDGVRFGAASAAIGGGIAQLAPVSNGPDAAAAPSSGRSLDGDAGGGGGTPLRNASPTSDRLSPVTVLAGRSNTPSLAMARPAGSTSTAAALVSSAGAAERARIVLQIATPVEVWLDNELVGHFRMGPSDKWIGTRGHPLEISPGEHLVALRNNAVAEPWEERIVVQAGETRILSSDLRRKPVTFQIDPSLPTDCRVRVGAIEYGTVRDFGASFSLREPEADARVVFRCPAPLGEFSEAIGPTFGGEFLVMPRQRP